MIFLAKSATIPFGFASTTIFKEISLGACVFVADVITHAIMSIDA